MFADDVNQVVVPILVLWAVRREPEARPIHGFIPCFRPAAFARGIVVESNHESLSAIICLEHQLVWHGRSGATHDRQRIAPARKEAVVTQGVDGGFDGDDALRFGEIPDREPRGELVPKARAERGLMPGVTKSGPRAPCRADRDEGKQGSDWAGDRSRKSNRRRAARPQWPDRSSSFR